jgi:ATP-dependent Clp protease protease subunit
MLEELVHRSFEKRISFLWGDIDEDISYKVVHELSFLAAQSSDPICLLIHSSGGDVDSAVCILDEMNAIKKAGITIITIAMGVAQSAAAMILSMGTKGHRYARPNSSIMLHPCSFDLQSDYELNQKMALEFITKHTDKLQRSIAEACGMVGKDYRKFLKDINHGLWLDADSALKYGIIDGVWDKLLPMKGFSNEEKNKQRTI